MNFELEEFPYYHQICSEGEYLYYDDRHILVKYDPKSSKIVESLNLGTVIYRIVVGEGELYLATKDKILIISEMKMVGAIEVCFEEEEIISNLLFSKGRIVVSYQSWIENYEKILVFHSKSRQLFFRSNNLRIGVPLRPFYGSKLFEIGEKIVLIFSDLIFHLEGLEIVKTVRFELVRDGLNPKNLFLYNGQIYLTWERRVDQTLFSQSINIEDGRLGEVIDGYEMLDSDGMTFYLQDQILLIKKEEELFEFKGKRGNYFGFHSPFYFGKSLFFKNGYTRAIKVKLE